MMNNIYTQKWQKDKHCECKDPKLGQMYLSAFPSHEELPERQSSHHLFKTLLKMDVSGCW